MGKGRKGVPKKACIFKRPTHLRVLYFPEKSNCMALDITNHSVGMIFITVKSLEQMYKWCIFINLHSIFRRPPVPGKWRMAVKLKRIMKHSNLHHLLWVLINLLIAPFCSITAAVRDGKAGSRESNLWARPWGSAPCLSQVHQSNLTREHIWQGGGIYNSISEGGLSVFCLSTGLNCLL